MADAGGESCPTTQPAVNRPAVSPGPIAEHGEERHNEPGESVASGSRSSEARRLPCTPPIGAKSYPAPLPSPATSPNTPRLHAIADIASRDESGRQHNRRRYRQNRRGAPVLGHVHMRCSAPVTGPASAWPGASRSAAVAKQQQQARGKSHRRSVAQRAQAIW